MINLRNKRGEFVMKDYVMIGLVLALIMAAVSFIVTDMSLNEDIPEGVNVSEIERFHDQDYIEDMNESTTTRLDNLQDAGFFKTVFLTTLEIVQMLPRLVGMTVKSIGSLTGLLLSGTLIPQEITIILSVMLFAGLLWAAVYFIRRLSK